MKPKSALAIAIIVPAVFASGAFAASKQSPPKTPPQGDVKTVKSTVAKPLVKSPTTSTSAARTPTVSATLDKSSYDKGATVKLTVTENIWGEDTIKVTDTAGSTWTRTSAEPKVSTYTTKANVSATVTVTLVRTWDKASATATASYKVNSTTTPTPTEPTPTNPTPTEPTPTNPTPTNPTPTTAWAGYTPGKFWLGMGCGGDCTAKEAALGQGYGVHRTFKQWGQWSSMEKEIKADHAAGRLPWVSYKPPAAAPGGWQAIANGNYDKDLQALATMLKANDDKPVLVTFHHEPSNDATEADGKYWAAAYVHIHDLLKAEGALGPNVSDPPILQDWLFDPINQKMDPINWATDAVLERIPFMGIDMYQNKTGEGYSVRIPRIINWMADRGFPGKMIGLGETGSTATYTNTTADKWLNDSLAWAANNTDKVGVISYFNTEVNNNPDVYWPLDESQAKADVFKKWLSSSTSIN